MRALPPYVAQTDEVNFSSVTTTCHAYCSSGNEKWYQYEQYTYSETNDIGHVSKCSLQRREIRVPEYDNGGIVKT